MSNHDDSKSRFQFGQTHWSLVFQAGHVEGEAAQAARQQLLVHYCEAVHRYLSVKLPDANAAGELFSRFAERVLEIHPFLQRADPGKGRFRDYLKAILQRMVIDYHRENQRENRGRRELCAGSDAEPMVEPIAEDADFQKAWTDELMNQAWKNLEQYEQATGKPYYSLMLEKAQHPEVRSDALAQTFSKKLDRPLTAENVRKLLQRGQEMLSDLLVEEVARSLRENEAEIVSAERVERELIELKLLDIHRRKALERYGERR